MCLVAATPQATSAGEVRGEMAGEEDQGCTSEEEEGGVSSNYERQVRILDSCFGILIIFQPI